MKIAATGVVSHPYRSMFELEITFMHGDADGYSKKYLREFDARKLIPAVEFFRRCEKRFPHGMGGDDGFFDVEGFEKYQDLIPMDSPYVDGHADIEDIKVFYYDGNGTRLKAEIIDEV